MPAGHFKSISMDDGTWDVADVHSGENLNGIGALDASLSVGLCLSCRNLGKELVWANSSTCCTLSRSLNF